MESNNRSMLARVKAGADRFMRALMPLTSLLTVAVVGYISYVYLFTYIRLLRIYVLSDTLGYTSFGVTLRAAFFLFWPTMIFWTLAAIVFGDAGVIDRKFIEKLYAENNIER